MQLVAAFLRISAFWEVRSNEAEQRDGVVARGSARKLLIDLRHVVTGRCKPRVLRIRCSPLTVSVFGEKKQMHRLIGQQLMRPVSALDLHRFVTDSQAAHLESAEITVRGCARCRQQSKQGDDGKRAPQGRDRRALYGDELVFDELLLLVVPLPGCVIVVVLFVVVFIFQGCQ